MFYGNDDKYYMTLAEVQKNLYNKNCEHQIDYLDLVKQRLDKLGIEPVFYGEKWEPYYCVYGLFSGYSLQSADYVS